MTDIVTVGIDLAKNVFTVHGIEATGKRRAAVSQRASQLAARTHCFATALPYWHGSLFGCSPLGARVCRVW